MSTLVEVPQPKAYARTMKARVSEKGQVTIPKQLRDQLEIRAGDEVDLRVEEGRLIATKVADLDPVDSVYGSLKLPAPTDELIAEMRGRRQR
jgi:AbrB family looped-hinge helix DNA binding protein